MAATRDDIKRWLEEGKRRGATHVIVFCDCDTFDFDDFPVYVMPPMSAHQVRQENTTLTVMECYSLSMDLEAQLEEHRAVHWD